MTKNNNFIEEVMEEIRKSNWCLYHYDKQLDNFVSCGENVKQFISQKLQQAQIRGIEIGIKKQLKINKLILEDSILKAKEELKKEIVEMIEKFFNEKETMSYYLSDELTDKIKNICI